MSDPQKPAFVPVAGVWERDVALHVLDLTCRRCARRAEEVLRGLPGVRGATVRRLRERADVRYDVRRTSARDMAAALGRAGFRVSTGPRPPAALAEPAALDLAVTLGAFAALMMLSTGAHAGDRRAAILRLALGSACLCAAAAALGRRVVALLRRGVLDRDAMALAGAAAMLALGVVDPAGGGLAAAAGISAAAVAARVAEAALRGRAQRELADRPRLGRAGALDAEAHAVLARLADTEIDPPEGSWDDVAIRGIFTAALGCASFALVTHGCLGGRLLAPLGITSAVAVLVAASPGAILVAGPRARALAVLAARRVGVLVKDPAVLLALAGVDVVCLEKSGTLTGEELRVTRLAWAAGVAPDPEALADVAALEQVSSHPVGRALAAALAAGGVSAAPLGPDARVAESANGIAGRVRDALVEVGSPARFGDPPADAPAETTVVLFARNGVVLGRFELSAPLSAGAPAVVHALAARRVRALLLSGDRREATAWAARRLGIPGIGGLGPSEKALAVRDLQRRGARVLLVGDGRLSAAVGAQADAAVAVAPGMLPGAVRVRVVCGRLEDLPVLCDLGRSLRAVLRENAALALLHNAVLIPAAALGYVPPLAAAGITLLETLAGLANAARLDRRPRAGEPYDRRAASAPPTITLPASPTSSQRTSTSSVSPPPPT